MPEDGWNIIPVAVEENGMSLKRQEKNRTSKSMEGCINGTRCRMRSYKEGTMKLVVYIHLMMQCISDILLRGGSVLSTTTGLITACFS